MTGKFGIVLGGLWIFGSVDVLCRNMIKVHKMKVSFNMNI